jgi:hypothetical protein
LPYNILSNKRNGRAVIHCVANSGNVIITGNTSASNIAVQDEFITGAAIRGVKWSSANNGTITISRQANVVLSLNYSGSLDFTEQSSVSLFPAANLVISILDGNSFVTVEVSKQFSNGTISEY